MQTGEPVLKVKDLGKLYSRSPVRTRARVGGEIARAFFGIGGGRMESNHTSDHWALSEVDLELARGEALGIIGLNGAGKTTLLRILAGQLLPDVGSVEIAGRSASMIDLTAGFAPGASGRDNIFLRGAALGRSEAEIAAQLDGIIEFSELGTAIDASVSTYSSGMVMRLAFSIMVASSPDVLFIDETLAVGDFRFKQKCLARLRQIRENTSFIMVSHGMGDIRAYCDRTIVLHQGRKVFEGSPDEAIDLYENLQFPTPEDKEKRTQAVLKPQFHNDEGVREVTHSWCDAEGRPIECVKQGGTLFLHLEFTPQYTPRRLILGVPVWRDDGTYVTGLSTQIAGEGIEARSGDRARFVLEVPSLAFNPGRYISNVVINDGLECLYRAENGPLDVESAGQTPTWGVVTVPHAWRPLR
jgi:ABC-type polysaccharide/polyol phosphate transport system ATPase subunit